MQIVETPHHIIRSSAWEKPPYSCDGACRKVWWRGDIVDDLGSKIIVGMALQCPQCKGKLRKAIEGKDYKTLDNTAGKNTFNDTSIMVQNAAWVKPEFEEQAKRNWR